MIHLLLAESGPTAMRLGGALLDEDLDLDVVTGGRALLDRLNAAPHYYHLVILGYELPDVSGPECIRVIRRLHERLPVLVLSDRLDADRAADLAALGVRRSHVLGKPAAPDAFARWVRARLDELLPPSDRGGNGVHTP